jgi:4a-hydroxytetrahydrobiopterin dehydratase
MAEAERYREQAPDWALVDDGSRIERNFTFGNFREALDFVVRVGELAEQHGHHPDIRFGWGHAKISWQTKKIRGLHENDFIMAAQTDRLVSGQGGRK